MTVIAETEKVLQNGTSTVLSGMRQARATSQFLPMTAQKLRQQMTRLTTKWRTHHLSVVPIATAAGATVVVAASAVAVSRFLVARQKAKFTEQ